LREYIYREAELFSHILLYNFIFNQSSRLLLVSEENAHFKTLSHRLHPSEPEVEAEHIFGSPRDLEIIFCEFQQSNDEKTSSEK